MNNFLNHSTSQPAAQGKPDNKYFFSTRNPNIRLGREENLFSTATNARKNEYINQIKKKNILTNYNVGKSE